MSSDDQEITLNCWVYGTDPIQSRFKVQISTNEGVYFIRKKIHEALGPGFHPIEDIGPIYKVSTHMRSTVLVATGLKGFLLGGNGPG
jgi:hypothetical protein